MDEMDDQMFYSLIVANRHRISAHLNLDIGIT